MGLRSGAEDARAVPCFLCYNNSVYGIILIIDRIVSLLTYLIILRALLSWIPSVDYRHPLMSLLIRVTDPILVPVRRLLPPAGGFDLSPLVAGGAPFPAPGPPPPLPGSPPPRRS